MNKKYFVRQATETSEGDNVDVKRLFPIKGHMNFDPFVLWDHFSIQAGSGFPDHPHRGFEAITYMFSGTMQHTDNLGNESTVGTGGAQRFTAGKGIVHSEMPGSVGQNNGIQLWINLPKRLKTLDPAYQEVSADSIQETSLEGVRIRHIVGESSPLRLHTDVIYEEVFMDAGASWEQVVPEGMRGFVYVESGELDINQHDVKKADALFFEVAEPLQFKAQSAAHIMFCAGRPHGEPIKQWGPYVD